MKHAGLSSLAVVAAAVILSTPARAGTIEIHDPIDPTSSVCATDFVRDCAFDYGFVTTGTSQRFSFSIENQDSTALTISSLTVTGSPLFLPVDAAPVSIAPGGTEIMSVDFAPQQAGEPAATATVTITSDATNLAKGEDVVISLTGTGEEAGAPGMEVAPGFCDFGIVGVGETVNCDLTITNIGTAELEINELGFSEDTPPVFAPAGVFVLPTFVQPGTAVSLSIAFTAETTTPATGAAAFSSPNLPLAPRPRGIKGAVVCHEVE